MGGLFQLDKVLPALTSRKALSEANRPSIEKSRGLYGFDSFFNFFDFLKSPKPSVKPSPFS